MAIPAVYKLDSYENTAAANGKKKLQVSRKSFTSCGKAAPNNQGFANSGEASKTTHIGLHALQESPASCVSISMYGLRMRLRACLQSRHAAELHALVG